MFCILSLDGGGIKGTFRASALAALEEATQLHSVSERKRSNGGEDVTHHGPEELTDEIATLDSASAEVLPTIRELP